MAHVIVSDETVDQVAEMIETWGRTADPTDRYYRDSTVELVTDIIDALGIRTLGWGQPVDDVAGIIGERAG